MAVSSGLRRKLEEMETRLATLLEEAGARAAEGDSREMRERYKEIGALQKVVTVYREFLHAERRTDEARLLERGEDAELAQLAREEIGTLGDESSRLEARLVQLLVAEPEEERRRVIVEVRAGTGGDEATLFAADLLRMYLRFAEIRGWSTEVLESQSTEVGGIREGTVAISGEGAYRDLRFESGVHRVQRVPKTEAQGRIHTSTATVAVLPEVEEIEVEIRPDDLEVQTMRSSGPGGQHVNKTSSAVRIHHLPTNTVVVCQDERSQHKNRTKAMRILRSKLFEARQRARDAERADRRRSMIGSAERSEKIRTYNFPQDRITDQRLDRNFHNLPAVLDGRIEALVEALVEKDREERLANL